MPIGSVDKGKPHARKCMGGKMFLALERIKAGYTHEQMANMLGMSRSRYTQIESGLKPATDDFWHRVSEIFDQSEDYLKREM